MITFIFAKSITALAGAGLAAFLISVVPEVKAEAPITGSQQVSGAKSDLLPKPDRLPALANGAACLAQAWPQYDQSCRFDRRRPADAARMVRVIALR
jgi:hypothetical protein